ncbi:MAG: tetratricopeptide repeat protein, partial [Chloroflexota bacterium]|nr:tetratricopeptide repeat protein [Chloroflexota bacterium]
ADDLVLDALDGLTSLFDKSLLQHGEQTDGEPRFFLLHTIQEYALEQLEVSGEAQATREAHATFYVALAEEAEPQLAGTEQVPWLARLDADKDNLRAALAWSLTGGSREQGLRLASALWKFWWLRGYLSEGREWLAALLEHPDGVAPALRAKALRAAGTLAYYHNDLTVAERCMEESLTLFREVGDKGRIGATLRSLAVIWSDQGQHYEQARRYAEESLALARELDEPTDLSYALENLGILEYYLGEYAQATTYLEEQLALSRASGDPHTIATSLHNLAEVARATHHYVQATRLHEESLTLFQAVESTWGVALSLQAQGELALAQGDLPRAARSLGEALHLFHELRDTQGIILTLSGFAALALGEGLAERAARLLGALATLMETSGVALKPPDHTHYQQRLAAAQAELDEALFAAAYTEGQAMTVEQAIAFAVDEVAKPSTDGDVKRTPEPA